MYVKSQFAETRVEALLALARAHPLATFVTLLGGDVHVDHIPCRIHEVGSGHRVLRAHMPRGNPVAAAFDGSVEALAIFHGPQAYMSPSWYPSKREHGAVVPTWNYAVVHARGRPRAVPDLEWLFEHLCDLTDFLESEREEPWKVSDAPRDFTERMARGLVGIEMPIDTLVGKWKVGQNRPLADRLGAAEGLRALGDDRSVEMANLMAAYARSD